MTKRANGEGNIRQRPGDGLWEARVTVGGKRRSFYGKTREAVHRQLVLAIKTRQDGVPVPSRRESVRTFAKGWLDATRGTVRPTTWDKYRRDLGLHVLPYIGGVPLSRLGPQHLQLRYAEMLEAGLSARSVLHVHAVIHRMLTQALRWGSVGRNVADLVDLPRAKQSNWRVLDAAQVRLLLETAEGDPLQGLYVLAVTTGMRQGELLALRWLDIDFDRGTLTVNGTLHRVGGGWSIGEPKTARSRRLVVLPHVARIALQRHRVAQLEARLKAGICWRENGLVFTTAIGTPLHPGNVLRRSYRPMLERAGIRTVRFHDLRHTSATLLLGQGVHPKIVSEMLGHSTVGITLDLYSHVTESMQRQAAGAMDAVLGSDPTAGSKS
ncbi:MAG: site-specific integrase [Candidatus Dormiibacterota bacterium]